MVVEVRRATFGEQELDQSKWRYERWAADEARDEVLFLGRARMSEDDRTLNSDAPYSWKGKSSFCAGGR